jgi:HPt (histidine-containing phosphotransfer) domain-containing protein
MSAHVFNVDVDRYLSAGMDGYIAKPLTPEALEAAIAKALPGGASPEPSAALDRKSFDDDLGKLGSVAMRKILDAAERTIPQRFRQMRHSLASDAIEPVAALAHATRSSAGAAGFEALFVSAGRLEAAAKAGDAASVHRHLADCEAGFAEAMREARGILAADGEAAQESLVANR